MARSDDPQMRLAAELRCAPPLAPDAFEQAVAAARAADVAIVAVGLDNDWETEGRDRTSLDLPGRQVELIKAVAAVQPRTIVAVVAGSPVDLSWAASVPGLLWCWLPGQEGGRAIADVLFGDVDPGGRLPCTMPARLEDTPAFLDTPPDPGVLRYQEGVFAGHRWYDARGIEPAFPFGFGLSYASCAVGAPRVAAPTVEPGGVVEVDVEVTNTSDRAGSEVVQLYVGDPDASVRRAPRELRTFAKVHLAPGEPRDVRLRPDHARPGVLGPGDERVGGRGGGLPPLGGGVVAGAVRSGDGGADRALDGARHRLRSLPGSVDRVHPIERLRYVARASGADQAVLVRETAQALAAFRDDPSGLVAACRRIVDRHPTSAPLWWLCARVLTSPDGQREAWAAVDEIEEDRTSAELAFALPEEGTACVIGWPELVGEALPPRGDVEVLAVDALGEGSGLVRRLVQAGIDAVDVPTSGLGAAVLSSDVLLLEAVAVGPTGFVAVSGSLAAATVARHARGAGVAGGRRRPAAARADVGRPRRSARHPGRRPVGPRRGGRAAQPRRPGVRSPRARGAGRRAASHRLPGRPRAVRRRERAGHLQAVDTRPMSRRDQIRMTDAEVDAFLAGRHTMNVASFNHDGTIHLVAMWYAVLDGDPVFWTFGKSQKIRNLQRDPRITLLVETGEEYAELMGVELVGRAEVDHRARRHHGDRRGRLRALLRRDQRRDPPLRPRHRGEAVRGAHRRRPGRELGPPQARGRVLASWEGG